MSDLNVYPLYVHYLHMVYTRNEYFQYCKRCGKIYPAHTANISGFCSEDCRKAQQKDNRRRYSKKVEDDVAEKAYRNCYMYWYNRLKSIRTNVNVPAEKIQTLHAEFELFRRKARPMKRDAQGGQISAYEFSDWLLKQKDYFDNLLRDLHIEG